MEAISLGPRPGPGTRPPLPTTLLRRATSPELRDSYCFREKVSLFWVLDFVNRLRSVGLDSLDLIFGPDRSATVHRPRPAGPAPRSPGAACKEAFFHTGLHRFHFF